MSYNLQQVTSNMFSIFDCMLSLYGLSLVSAQSRSAWRKFFGATPMMVLKTLEK